MARVVLFARMFTKSNVFCCDVLYLYTYIYIANHGKMASVGTYKTAI